MKSQVAISLLALLPVVSAAPAVASEPSLPFLLDVRTLNTEILLSRASNALSTPIVTIIEKTKPSPSGDAHDYISYGRYWWPDPASSNGLPYIRKDGHANREQMALGDRSRFENFNSTLQTLAAIWHLEHQTNCALRAGDWLRAWFITPSTRMNPSFDYAQIRLGRDGNKGSSSGLIDGRVFSELIDSLRLLQDSPALTATEDKAVRKWFAGYLRWLTTSKNGRREHQASNNHGSWYLVQAISIARHLGNDEQARKFAREDFARISNQFKPDGSQPLEMVRTDGLSYCVFNLEAQFQVATLAAPLGIDLWHFKATNGASLRQGLKFLEPYNTNPQRWPHKQLKKLEPGFLNPLLLQAARIWPEDFNPNSEVGP